MKQKQSVLKNPNKRRKGNQQRKYQSILSAQINKQKTVRGGEEQSQTDDRGFLIRRIRPHSASLALCVIQPRLTEFGALIEKTRLRGVPC